MSFEIKINCSGELVDVSTLNNFQGNLKTLTSQQFDKIKNSIIRYGFTFPVFVWQNNCNKNFIIDGHQRVFVVQKMVENEEYILPNNKVPVAWIKAENIKEAKEKILIASSRYARIEDGGLYDFLQTSDIDIDDVNAFIDLPDIDLSLDNLELENKQKEIEPEDLKLDNKCPKCGYEY